MGSTPSPGFLDHQPGPDAVLQASAAADASPVPADIAMPDDAVAAAFRTDWQSLGYTSVSVTRAAGGIDIQARAQDAPRHCPSCGTPALTPIPLSGLVVHDLPVQGRPTVAHIRWQSQRCRYCRAMLESEIPGVDIKRCITHRLAAWIATRFDRAIEDIARETGARVSVIRHIVQPAAEARYGRQPGPPKWFQLPGMRATHHVISPCRYDIYVQLTNSRPPCPDCGSINVQRSATHHRYVHDRPRNHKHVALTFKCYRSFRCLDCERNFNEPMPNVASTPKHPRLTQRLIDWIGQQAGTRVAKEIAADSGVPVGSVQRILLASGGPIRTFVPHNVPVAGWQPLPDTVVTRHVEEPDWHHIYVRAIPKVDRCPACGSHTVMPHWRRDRAIRDAPLGGKPVTLHYGSIVNQCGNCGQAAEQTTAGIDAALKATVRLMEWIAQRLQSEPEARVAQGAGLRMAVVHGIARAMGDR